MADTEKTTLILKQFEDWDPWIKTLQTNHETVWQYIDPAVADNLAPVPLTQPARITFGAVQAGATTYMGLTNPHRKIYNDLRRNFDADMKYYTQEKALFQTAKSWITSHTSLNKQKFLVASDTLRVWVKKLKEDTEPPEGFMQQEARSKYQSAIRSKPTKLLQWIDQWEAAIEDAITYELPDLGNGQWLRDVATCIRPISDGWAVQYEEQATDPARRDVEAEFRKVANKLRRLQPRTSGRTTRGNAFPTFGGLDEDADSEAGPSTKTRKRAGTKSREKDSTKRNAVSCEGCDGLGHTLPQCWAVFEELRPDGMEANKKRERKVAKKLKEDKELKAKIVEIRRVRAAGQAGQPSSD